MAVWLYWLCGCFAVAGITATAFALFWDRSCGRKRCPKCWYDMSGARQGDNGWLCPECGHTARVARKLGRTRRHWRWAALWLTVAIAGTATPISVKLREPGTGWWTFTPTWALFWI